MQRARCRLTSSKGKLIGTMLRTGGVKTAGLIGFGQSAICLAQRLRAANMHVLYTRRMRLSGADEARLGVEWVSSVNDVLQRSDFACLTYSYNPSTHKVIGERELRLMKPTAFLLNFGGRLVDEPALMRALQAGTIAGAGVDGPWVPYIPCALRTPDIRPLVASGFPSDLAPSLVLVAAPTSSALLTA